MPSPATTSRPYPSVDPLELVLGLVYGAGTESEPFERLLRDCLRRYGYELRTVHLSANFPVMFGKADFKREAPNAMRQLQDMGDRLREATREKEILGHLAAFLIASQRTQRRAAGADGRVAWLVRSLKRPEEVRALRRIYGPRFVLFGLHAPESVRQRNAANNRERWANVTSRRFDAEATADIRRDEQDRTNAHGQRVRDTFAQADFFVDGRSARRLDDTLPRTIRLIFGEPFEPPHRDEQAMYAAFTAGLRSAEMGRQVGAAIMSMEGDVIAVGTNEVPAGGGGLYWSPDQPDGRDFARQPPLDSNTLWQRRVARELLVRMAHTGWLNRKRAVRLDDGDFDIDETALDVFLAGLDGTRFRAITEFGRSVHAEMDAITSTARRGIAIADATLACTTFPCHNCTRHLIAAGIARAIYIHPYMKSLARDLHEDALVIEPELPGPIQGKLVLEQYIGVAPRVYPQYFDFGQTDRKEGHGRAMRLSEPDRVTPRVLASGGTFSFGGPAFPSARTTEIEQASIADLEGLISRTRGIQLPVTSR
jgi:deoxycytidylate deaminase